MRFSACIEWLFAAEAPVFADRIRLAKDAGLDAVEFWRWSNKDLDAVEAALKETGLPLAAMLCEPIVDLADRGTHPAFLDGVRASVATAQRLGSGIIIAQSGNVLSDVPRNAQRDSICWALWQAGEIVEESGVLLALEPLNDRIDHPGYYLTSTVEGLDIVDQVASTAIKLLYDIYHAAVMEEPIELLDGRIDRVVHVHLADAPGRHEPGTGRLDYAERSAWLRAHNYLDMIGLEYRPTGGTLDSLAFRENVRD